MRRIRESGLWILFASVLLMSAAAFGPIEAEEEEEAAGFMAAKGRVTFRTYCASCHGREAKGDGNLAQYLSVKPSDLTQISARRDGQFPRDEIAEIIDGRQTTRGHGSREMPVWGDVFQSPLSETERGPEEKPEDRVRRKVDELVYFLESIQADTDPLD